VRTPRAAALAVAALLTACRAEAPAPDVAGDSTAGATATAVVDGANVFDPGGLQVGDRFLDLTVESKDVERVFEDSVWVGDVGFTGDLVVQGVYQTHPDWPNVTDPCFHVVDPASAARIPRFPMDDRTTQTLKTWFCFDPADVALEVLGSPEQPRELVVALDHYHVRRHFSDAYDTAELMELIEQGPAARRTLLDP
jgi:hypothetical protein